MRPIFKTGNVVSALLDKEVDFIIHVTNAQLVMGSGVAKEIRDRIPAAYRVYMENQVKGETGTVTSDSGVFNMTAQKYYGYDGKRYLDYGALVECLFNVRAELAPLPTLRKVIKVGLPHHMGSDRAGSDWNIVMELVHGILGKNYQLVVYKLEEARC